MFPKHRDAIGIWQTGFTLIEILVSIAILGILAVVVIPNVAKFLGSAKTGAAATELSIVKVAIVAYQTNHDGSIVDKKGVTGPGDILDDYLDSVLTGTYDWDNNGLNITQTWPP